MNNTGSQNGYYTFDDSNFLVTLCNMITFAWWKENWKLCSRVSRNLIFYLSLNLQNPRAILHGIIPLCKGCVKTDLTLSGNKLWNSAFNIMETWIQNSLYLETRYI
jgi:hypothetical protein